MTVKVPYDLWVVRELYYWEGAMPTNSGVHVARGTDRSGEELRIWGLFPHHVKVATADSGGDVFIFEHADMGKGGPPRHFHHDQDEWFYAVKGEFVVEVGDERFELAPGDIAFAPRQVPHAWAHLTDEPGTLLVGVSPAGTLEQFFRKGCEMTAPPSPQETSELFAAHGMQVVGPPLSDD
jgi:mannose-6-phosphate isomerase-like protein (cupin superfamily)